MGRSYASKIVVQHISVIPSMGSLMCWLVSCLRLVSLRCPSLAIYYFQNFNSNIIWNVGVGFHQDDVQKPEGSRRNAGALDERIVAIEEPFRKDG